MDEILELLARWNELTDEERGTLTALILAEDALAEIDDLGPLLDELRATAEAIIEGEVDDTGLAALEFLAAAVNTVSTEIETRETADSARAEQAQALAEQIRGSSTEGGDDDDPGEGGDTGDDGDDEGDEGDEPETVETDEPEAVEQPEPVAASGTPRVSRVAARRPRAAQPRQTQTARVAPLVASAGVPGVAMGARLTDPERFGQALMSTLRAMGSMALRPGMQVPVATASVEYPDAGFLDSNVRGNSAKLEAAQALAITASGGICAPPQPSYVLDSWSVEDRPFRASLPNWGLDRGGALIPGPMLLEDLDGAAQTWTLADDEDAATDPDVRKTCLRMDCGDDFTAVPEAVVQCLEIGNWNARTWPERVARFQQLADAWTSRYAEQKLLTKVGAESTAVTVPGNLGTARDILAALDLAIAAIRNRHRMSLSTRFVFATQAFLLNQIRSDLTREMPGSAAERLAAADAEIEAFFTARNVRPVWLLDGEVGQQFGPQADGPLLGWIPNMVAYLYPENTWQYGNGGELNLGLVRDSDLNSRNDFQFFKEFWETAFMTGPESYRLSFSVCPSGASAGTVEPVCVDSQAS
jgi:hypothetical protein